MRGGHTLCLRHRHHLHTEIRTMGKGRDIKVVYAVVDPAPGMWLRNTQPQPTTKSSKRWRRPPTHTAVVAHSRRWPNGLR